MAGTEHLNDAVPRTSKALNATFVAKKEFADRDLLVVPSPGHRTVSGRSSRKRGSRPHVDAIRPLTTQHRGPRRDVRLRRVGACRGRRRWRRRRVRTRRPSRSRRCPTRYQAYRSDFVYPEPVERSVKAQTATTYTLTLTHNGKLVTLSNAAAITVTVPIDAAVAFPAGASIDLLQLGAGQITVSPTGGVTVNKSMATATSRTQYSVLTLTKIATDTWVLSGDAATS